MGTSPRDRDTRPNGSMHVLRALAPAMLIAACSTAPSAAPTTTAAPTTAASPHAGVTTPAPESTTSPKPLVTPAPLAVGPAVEPFGEPVDPDPNVTRAVTTVDGVRVTVAVDSSTIKASDAVEVRTTLQNVGKDTLHWATDGCEIHVLVSAVTPVKWAYGAEQPYPFGTFKNWLLELYDSNTPVRPISLQTVPWQFAGHGEFGCADIGLGHDLAPGGKITGRYELVADTWAYGPAPEGPVDLAASFEAWNRGADDPDAIWRKPVVAHLPILVKGGRDPGLLSPGQAVDVALRSPALQDLLRRYPAIPDFAPLDLTYDVATEWWTVHAVFASRSTQPMPLTIVVDARSASIVEVRNPEE